jgi:hypothetical protein
MITTDAVSKATRYTCERCGLKASRPIVIPVAGEAAQCSNKRACERRVLRSTNRAREKKA